MSLEPVSLEPPKFTVQIIISNTEPIHERVSEPQLERRRVPLPPGHTEGDRVGNQAIMAGLGAAGTKKGPGKWETSE